jgi:arylsulfatase A-like enzyme
MMKILVLQVPSLHLGYLGCYGNEWNATPALDRLAAEGVVFDGHFADTVGDGRPAWTGRRPMPSAAAADPSAPGPAANLKTLLDAAEVPFVVVRSGEAVEGVDPGEGTPLEMALEGIVQALDRLGGADHWLLWADLPPLAPPWSVPALYWEGDFTAGDDEESDEDEAPLTPLPDPAVGPVPRDEADVWQRLQLTYAGVVRYLDAGLGLLLKELTRRGSLGELLLAVTSERGLALAEHGIVGDYRPWLHEEVMHVPLVVRLPGAAAAGLRVAGLTQPVDLFLTLLEAFGLAAPEGHGRSLWPLLREETQQLRPYACAGWRAGQGVEWSLRTARWALTLPAATPPGDPPREPRLYLKPDDRWEVNDLRPRNLELAEGLEAVLRDFVAATHRPGPLEAPALPALHDQLQTPPASGAAAPEGG